ncbi:vitamin K epoxide reductase family protein [Leptolyngbya sp. NK1-12]|uniref:Vitamin K epoxide reductase family protein n=1 Tax=Leptolyngbya sp. NK1-12 TaxID=2547451 RepID=A0AA96WKE3_9CYAN|nr:vitamin K epoxide reductase family protein [Leptolyngbya sp. NK1-12]MBF2046789.1 vitamin K epoxide reductase family protein [Elainella sp. C42_A2020_010]RNJ68524.1 MAG: vitamin K epoxide reductase family protein [Leptolyngbya sp. IPPAS B-1204]WNZ27188.1 vitamin K epoxide reductase family protein [Leptolyngbya sp. NK1-12]
MDPIQLSKELREGTSSDLERRRWIVGLSAVSASMAQIVTLYQMGILKQLPDLPIPFVDSDRVDASAYAYSRLNTPDGPLMLVNYGITAWLTTTGGENRAKEAPLIPIAMGVKLLIDAIAAVELAREEWSENKAFCEYCQVATLCSFASLALAAPEVITAVQTLLGQKD